MIQPPHILETPAQKWLKVEVHLQAALLALLDIPGDKPYAEIVQLAKFAQWVKDNAERELTAPVDKSP